ncbi:MAG TPA: VWA domain-containing protein [Candidatus Bathyarchaeia archaeon]|nr:VWA domain-containing protein [Candidatus Bathyarchaeia archaeon]
MFRPRLTHRLQGALLSATLALFLTAIAFAQEQKLPDAPGPQNNAPAPNVNVPPPVSGDQGSSSSVPNPEPGANTRESGQQQTNPQPPPPGSQEIKTVPPGSVPRSGQSGPDELFSLVKNVSFVTVPVTVKDNEGKMVDGLLAKDFSVYEDGALVKLSFFTSDPFPLSAALIVDQGLPDAQLKKVNQTFSALGGAFSAFDEVAVFTYGNTVNKRQDFGNSNRMELALHRIADDRGANNGASVIDGPFGAGPVTNGKPPDGARQVITPRPEFHVLNDAILTAAQDLAHRSPTSRKIIFIISDGQEYGSRASYAQVLKVLLTDGIAVYAIGVNTAALPIYDKVAKARIPGFGYSNILPRYVNATGGDVLDEFSKEAIESAYQRITLEARNQYTLGYNTAQRPSSNYRDIEVRVKRPGLEVFAKHGYYPLPPQRELPPPPPPPESGARETPPSSN